MNYKIVLIVILYICIFALLVYGIYLMFNYLHERRNLISIGIKIFYKNINNAAKSRKIEEAEVKSLYGNIKKDNLISKIDERVRYSGFQKKYPFLTTELLIVCCIMMASVACLIGFLFTGKWYVILIIAVSIYLIAIAVINTLCSIRYKQTKVQMIPFINMIAGNALSNSDIVHILKVTAEELEEPLRSAIFEACDTAERTGDTSEALRNLEEDIEYPFFKTIIRNLEMASRTLANYGKVIEECREMLQNSLEHEREVYKIYDSGRADMLLTVFGGVVCIIFLSTGLIGMSVSELINVMIGNVIGSILLVYVSVSLLIGIYYSLTGGVKKV